MTAIERDPFFPENSVSASRHSRGMRSAIVKFLSHLSSSQSKLGKNEFEKHHVLTDYCLYDAAHASRYNLK